MPLLFLLAAKPSRPVASTRKLRSMFWRRLITTWLCVAMVLLGAGTASAASSARAKPHQGFVELFAALNICTNAVVSVELHTGNGCLSDTVTSDVPHAARGAAGILARSEAAGGRSFPSAASVPRPVVLHSPPRPSRRGAEGAHQQARPNRAKDASPTSRCLAAGSLATLSP